MHAVRDAPLPTTGILFASPKPSPPPDPFRASTAVHPRLLTITPTASLLPFLSPSSPAARMLRSSVGAARPPENQRVLDEAREAPPVEHAAALRWIASTSLPIRDVGTTDGVRTALRAIGRKLDGTKAAPATTVRKRAALSAVLNYAVESGYLDHNPLRDVRRKREPVTDVVDPRVVVNPDQARALLREVERIAPDLLASFATIYFAAPDRPRPGTCASGTSRCRRAAGAGSCSPVATRRLGPRGPTRAPAERNAS